MKSSVKMSKRILFFVVFSFLTFNSFAAVVSDNDGTTFVTKAEFDELKTSFSKQVVDYNESIDGKIDGAIASYLAGFQLAKVSTIENYALDYKVTGAKHSTVSGKEVVYWTTSSSYVLCNKSTQKVNYDFIWVLLAPNREAGTNYWQLEYRGNVKVTGDSVDRLCAAGLTVNNVSKMTYNLNGVREMGETFRENTTTPTTGFWNSSSSDKNEKWPDSRNTADVQINFSSNGSTSYFSWNASSYTEKTENATTAVKIAPYSVGIEYIDDKDTTKIRKSNASSGDYVYPSSLSWIGGKVSAGVSSWQIDPTYHTWTIQNDNSTSGTPNSFIRGITHNTLKFNDYVTVDSSNSGYLTDGLLLCQCEKDGKLHIDAEVSADGWLYVWRSDTPTNKWHDRVLGDLRTATTVSNWASPTELKYQSDFKTTSKRLKKVIDVQKGEKVWFTYLPYPSDGYIVSFDTSLEVK